MLASLESYFPEEERAALKNDSWIQSSFMPDLQNPETIMSSEVNDIFLEILSDSSLELLFKTVSLADFGYRVRDEFPQLATFGGTPPIPKNIFMWN